MNTSDYCPIHILASKLDTNKKSYVSVSPRHTEFNKVKPEVLTIADILYKGHVAY